MNSLLIANSAWHNMLRVLPVDDIMVADDRGAVCHVGVNVAGLTGFSVDEIISRPASEVLTSWSDGDFPFWREASLEDPATLSSLSLVPFALSTRTASPVPVEGAGLAITLGGRRWTIVLIARLGSHSHESGEISAARHELIAAQLTAAAVLAESEERFRHSFGDNMAPMMMTNIDDRIIAVNDAFCSMIGWTRDALLNCDSTPFTFPEDIGISEVTNQRLTSDQVKQARYVKRYLHKDGRVIIVEISKSAAYDANGDFLYFVISERDITEERALSAQLSHQALHDPLTGLANRAVFEDRLHQAQARVLRHGGFNAVLLMDLDDFKGVNDTYGHVMGDQLLTAVSKRLEVETRSSDTLCRFGGDEFLYLAEGLTSPDEAETLAVRLRDVIARPVQVAGAEFEVRASIGIVVWNGKDIDDTQIIQNADSAMYEAKRRGKGGHVIFTASLQQQAINRFALTQELRQALHGGELSMHYQPIMDLSTTHVVGFEALMRWQHPERGAVPPNVFIALAEQSDLILELGTFAIREAVAACATWSPSPLSGETPFVTVNFSSRQFHDPTMVSTIVDSLMSSGIGPERLVMEITESTTLLDVAETLQVIDQLNRLGIGIALDDFGTGYSSLSYLTLLRPKIIKIDQSFVSPAHESVHNDTLLQTIVSLGRKLNMTVLAEGIETKPQLNRLQELGCDLGQGYLFSPAVAAHEVQGFIDLPSGRDY